MTPSPEKLKFTCGITPIYQHAYICWQGNFKATLLKVFYLKNTRILYFYITCGC